MRSEEYSDEELVEIWRSWGVEFAQDVSAMTAARFIRELENNKTYRLSYKYDLLFGSSLNEEILQLQLNNLYKEQESDLELNYSLENSLEWSFLILEMQGAFEGEIPSNVEGNILTKWEYRLIKAWIDLGFSSEIFLLKNNEIIIQTCDEFDVFSEFSWKLMFESKNLKGSLVLALLTWRTCLKPSDCFKSELNEVRFNILGTNCSVLSEKNYRDAWSIYHNNSFMPMKELNPTWLLLIYNWGVILFEKGRQSETESKYREVLNFVIKNQLTIPINASHFLVYSLYNLADILKGTNQLDDYNLTCQKCIETMDSDALKELEFIIFLRFKLLISWAIYLFDRKHWELAYLKYIESFDYFTPTSPLNTEHQIEIEIFKKPFLLSCIDLASILEKLELVCESELLCHKLDMIIHDVRFSIEELKDFDNYLRLHLMFLHRRGDFRDIEAKCKNAWNVFYIGSIHNNSEFNQARLYLLSHWGWSLFKQNKFSCSVEKYKESCNYIDTEDVSINYACEIVGFFSNYAYILEYIGYLDEANKLCMMAQNYIELVRSKKNNCSDVFNYIVTMFLIQWGNIYLKLGNTTLAEKFFKNIFEEFIPSIEKNGFNFNIDDKSRLLLYYGITLNKSKRHQEAIGKFELAEEHAICSSEGTLYSRGRWLSKIYLHWSFCYENFIPFEWAFKASKTLAVILELADWKLLNHGEVEVFYNFAKFHLVWLVDCLETGRLDDLPHIFNAIQGRKLARLTLDELDHSDISTDKPESVKAFKRLRTELRKIALDIKVLTGGMGERGGKWTAPHRFVSDSPNQSRNEDIQQRLKELEESYRKTSNRYAEIREQVLKLEPYRLLAEPFVMLTLPQVLQRLKTGQALLLVADFDLSKFQSDRIEQQTVPLHGLAWLLFSDGSIRTQSLDTDFLPILIRQLSTNNRLSSGSLRFQMRKAPITGDGDTGANIIQGWQAFSDTMHKQIWQPVEELLPHDLDELIVVSHGRFHQLPLSLGRLHRYPLTHYPGLHFFLHAEDKSAESVELTPQHAAIIYSGSDLLLAPHDGHLLKRLVWDRAEGHHAELQDHLPESSDSSIQPLQSLYFSCHGDVHPEHPDMTHLNLGDGHKITFHEILRMKYRPVQVFIGACVAGNTREDLAGDPLGPVTAFFLRGAKCVVACLTPVPDGYMPLLTLLTEYTAVSKNLPMDQALDIAKCHLSTWQTDPDYAHLVDDYRDWLTEAMVKNLDIRLQKAVAQASKYDEKVELLIDQTEIVLGHAAFKEIKNLLFALCRQTDDIETLVRAVVDLILPIQVTPDLIDEFLSPPDDVVELLTHSVRAFGKGVVVQH